MSASGKYLVMERLGDLKDDQSRERRAPPWVTDKKRSAFGVNATNEIKLRDYGQLALGFFRRNFRRRVFRPELIGR